MKWSTGVAAVLSLPIMTIDASIEQIQHIIIFMQENRAYDHYFGTLRGVRGFNDRVVVPLRSGLPVFYQPTNQSDLSSYMLPFRATMKETSASCMDAPEMNYPCDIRMWNNGHFDSWNTGRSPGNSSTYSFSNSPYCHSH
jgi:phospholipase C